MYSLNQTNQTNFTMNSSGKKKKLVEKEYKVEKILDKRLTDEGKLEYFLKWKDFPGSENSWVPIENLNCPEMIQVYEDSLENKLSGKKRKLLSTDNADEESVLQKTADEAKVSNESTFRNNSLPQEILIKIFAYLRQNELGRIAQVCRRWNACVKCPILWKKVDVRFLWKDGSINEVVSIFSENLSESTTHLLFDFSCSSYWLDRLQFEEFCMNMCKRCPGLQSLIFLSSKFSVSLAPAIDICAHFLPNLEVLSFRNCRFGKYLAETKCRGISKIKLLDLDSCLIEDFDKYLPLKMPCLKKLYSGGSGAIDIWLGETSSLQQLEVLQVCWSRNVHALFRNLLSHALNITVLFLCWTAINDNDFRFINAGFPKLETICLVRTNVTYKSIIYLIQSCPSLQNIYVAERVKEEYDYHPFAAINKSNILETNDVCDQHCFIY